MRGRLGLKDWIDSALEPVKRGDLHSGYHPQPKGAPGAPKATSTPQKTKEQEIAESLRIKQPDVDYAVAKQVIDASVALAAKYVKDVKTSSAALDATIKSISAAERKNIDVYYSTLPPEVQQLITKDRQTLKETKDNMDSDLKGAQTSQGEASAVDTNLKTGAPVPQTTIDKASSAATQAGVFADNAKQQLKAVVGATKDLTTYKPDPPLDALGHSVQFVVNYGGSVTPSWSLIAWKGPGLAVPGASASGIRTNIMNIAFGPADQQTDLLLKQTLTSLLPAPIIPRRNDCVAIAGISCACRPTARALGRMHAHAFGEAIAKFLQSNSPNVE